MNLHNLELCTVKEMNKNGLCFMIFTYPMACIPANVRTWDMIFSTSCLLNQHSPWAVSD